MKIALLLVCISFVINKTSFAQENDMYKAAENFVGLLDKNQKIQIMYPFDSAERYTWHFVPKDDRKGLSINEMKAQQKDAALKLMKTAFSAEIGRAHV